MPRYICAIYMYLYVRSLSRVKTEINDEAIILANCCAVFEVHDSYARSTMNNLHAIMIYEYYFLINFKLKIISVKLIEYVISRETIFFDDKNVIKIMMPPSSLQYLVF